MTNTTSPARSGAPAKSRSRLRQWLGGWRVSLRMARRDIARHRWRSALIAATIGVPVLLMVSGLTVYQTNDIDAREDVPARFGSAQALVAGRVLGVPRLTDSAREFSCSQPDAAHQDTVSYDGSWEFVAGSQSHCRARSTATALPGLATAKPSLGVVASAVSTMTNARVVPMSTAGLDVQLASEQSFLGVVRIDGADPMARGMVELASGRWAIGPDEAVVTDVGRRRGLSAGGVVNALRDRKTARTKGPLRPITIVGTARTAPSAGPNPELIMAPPTAIEGTMFLIDRSEPVTWSDMQQLASYGLVTYSKDVVLNPPEEALAATRTATPSSGFPPATRTALLCLVLLVQSCLLAGPAFAVIAQRQRRTLALTAVNGATRAQLRRTMLAEALVLGVATALAGTVLGMCAAWAGMAVIERLPVESIDALDNWFLWLVVPTDFGPFDVPWVEVGIVIGFAVLAAIVSALTPTRGLGRLDVVSALREVVVSPRRNRGVPVLGGSLAVLGAALVFLAVLDLARPIGEHDVIGPVAQLATGGIGLIVLVVGTLLLVPSILVAVAALSAHAPVVVRMAARQVSRQQGRSVPTVAAVMAGSILLAGFAIVTSTHERGERALYPPQAPLGQIIVWVVGGEQDAINATIVATAPDVTLRQVGKLSTVKPDGADPSSQLLASTVVFAPPGCTPAQVFADPSRTGPPPPPGAAPQQRKCSGEVAGWWQVFPGGVVVATAADASELFDLEASATRTLQAGGVVLAEPNGWVTPSLMTVYTGTASVESGSDKHWNAISAQRDLPAAAMAPPPFVMPGMNMKRTDIRAVITPQTAAALGASTKSDVIYVSRPQGMTPEDATRLAAATRRDPRYDMQLEQGYQSPSQPFQVGVYALIALLILIATLTSSALSIGEQRRDLATVGAVGAAPGMRRRLAAVQAGGLAFVGTLLGLIVGAVPGSAFSLAISGTWRDAEGWDGGGYVEVPWLVLLGVLVVVPLLAAGLAALFVPSHPDLTRRAD